MDLLSNALLNVKSSARGVIRGNGPLKRVTVEVVQARNLVCLNENGRSDPFVEISLGGTQVRKTQTAFKSLDPVYRETFEFGARSLSGGRDSTLLFTVYNTDVLGLHDSMGYFEVDFSKNAGGDEYYNWCPIVGAPVPNKRGLKKNKAALAASEKKTDSSGHAISVGDGPGEVLVSIRVSDMFEKELTPEAMMEVKKDYCGWVKVHIIDAVGLQVAEGSCDPYCVVRVGNKCMRTESIKATGAPKWDVLIQLPTKDIFDVVEINIMNEDRRGATDFIGGIMVPLLDIPDQNSIPQWYSLKTENHIDFVNETSAIQVALHYSFSKPLGALSLFQKRDARHIDDDPPFSFGHTRTLGERLKVIALVGVDAMNLANQALNFEFGPEFNVGVLIGWIIFWALIELYMIPFFLAVAIIGRGVQKFRAKENTAATPSPTSPPPSPSSEDGQVKAGGDAAVPEGIAEVAEIVDKDDDADEEVSLLKPESIMRNVAKVSRMRNVLQVAQNLLQDAFDHAERVNNMVNWSNPIVSGVIVVILLSSTVIMMFFPLRLIPIFGGIAVFAQASLLHYLPSLQNAPKHSFQKRLAEFIHVMPSPIAVAVNAFTKFPSDTDLKRRANHPIAPPIEDAPNGVPSAKIQDALEREKQLELAAKGITEKKAEAAETKAE